MPVRVLFLVHQILQKRFGVAVLRMRFSGKNKLHGTLRVANHLSIACHVGQKQIPAFISRHATRETDGQNVGREKVFHVFECSLIVSCEPVSLAKSSLADIGDKLIF